MGNAVHAFKDRDIKRIIRAVRASGERIARIEVDPNTGKICVITVETPEAPAAPARDATDA